MAKIKLFGVFNDDFSGSFRVMRQIVKSSFSQKYLKTENSNIIKSVNEIVVGQRLLMFWWSDNFCDISLDGFFNCKVLAYMVPERQILRKPLNPLLINASEKDGKIKGILKTARNLIDKLKAELEELHNDSLNSITKLQSERKVTDNSTCPAPENPCTTINAEEFCRFNQEYLNNMVIGKLALSRVAMHNFNKSDRLHYFSDTTCMIGSKTTFLKVENKMFITLSCVNKNLKKCNFRAFLDIRPDKISKVVHEINLKTYMEKIDSAFREGIIYFMTSYLLLNIRT